MAAGQEIMVGGEPSLWKCPIISRLPQGYTAKNNVNVLSKIEMGCVCTDKVTDNHILFVLQT